MKEKDFPVWFREFGTLPAQFFDIKQHYKRKEKPMEEKEYILTNGLVVLTRHDMMMIAGDYWWQIYREAAELKVNEYSKCESDYTEKDFDDIAEEVFASMYSSDLVYDNVERYIWPEIIAAKDDEIIYRKEI